MTLLFLFMKGDKMEEYKPNSNRFKEEQRKNEERKVEKIVTTPVITKKKSTFRKFKDSFISDDVKDVKTFIFGDVLIPTIKKAAYDIFTGGIDILFYGESRGNRRSASDRVSYRNYYDSYNRYSSRSEPRRTYATYEYDEVILGTRAEAEEVLDALEDMLTQYGLVRVADLYDMVGVSGDPTNNAYGWTSLKNARIVRVKDGYLIEMPKAMPID